MVAHYERDYTLFFEKEDVEKLQRGETLNDHLRGPVKIPLTVSLKKNDEVYGFYKPLHDEYLKTRRSGKETDYLIFMNETELAVVYWKGEEHILYFQETWFTDITTGMLAGKFNSRTIRWGGEKITILAGESGEAKRFKDTWS
jgi:hypothetical protein